MECVAIVVAAGRGTRAGDGVPKQYRRIGGEPVLKRSLDALAQVDVVDAVQPVIGGDDSTYFSDLGPLPAKILPPVAGGADRQASVLAGLEAIAVHTPRFVLVHDAARPFVPPEVIRRVRERLATCDAVVPVVAVTDTLRERIGENEAGDVVPRDRLLAMQTPQGFAFDRLLAAHRKAAATAERHTDDAAVAAAAGMAIATVDGARINAKLTSAEDIREADERLLARQVLALSDIRTGTGYDVHRFGPGDHVVLGGVTIPHTASLVGHSDADVILHALTDAILGALADGDIGAHFPPSDPQWRGAASEAFLRDAVRRVTARGGRLAHLDATLIGEAPRIGPHRDRMRTRIAEIAGIAPGRVGIKATTNERLGFIGREEGLAAMATATVRLPEGDDT